MMSRLFAHAEFDTAGTLLGVGLSVGDVVEDLAQRSAEEDRYDRGRGLVGA